MGMCVCGGAILRCPFGIAPSVLNVLPLNRVVSSMPIATIMDNVPMVNILPFGMCSCPANPTVAAATTAALGVLTPMPCIPAVVAPWTPGSPQVLIGSKPALSASSKCVCMWGGVIEITSSGQFTISIP